jgi:hypothetical protein
VAATAEAVERGRLAGSALVLGGGVCSYVSELVGLCAQRCGQDVGTPEDVGTPQDGRDPDGKILFSLR